MLLPKQGDFPTLELEAVGEPTKPLGEPKHTADWGRSTESHLGAGSNPNAVAELANVSIPGYRILGELGRGGMGVVYRAQQVGINRPVALKMIIAGGHASAEQLLRFQAEAEAVGRLHHPNIVQIYDIGKHDGLPYFSLEFVDGKSLDKQLAGQPQPEAQAAALTETLARAMHYAHENNVIHRDLKPANILLTKAGIPKISDFGLAKQMENDSSQTKTGTIMGTPSYMAPEQGRGERNIGHPADVYALGSMLYEMLTGRPPFIAATALKTLMRLLNEEPVPPSRIQPGLSRDLETICMKCLQKAPNRRYGSALELAEDLRRFQNGEAILARPVSLSERTWRWIKRNPRTTILSSAVAILLIAVAISLSLMGLRIAREREAIAETRKHAAERLEQATAAISTGAVRRTLDLLVWTDPLLSVTPELADAREQLDQLRAQTHLYASYYQLLDRVRYYGLYCTPTTAPKSLEYSAQLLKLYDEIETRQGTASPGWPPLDDERRQELQEDVFEMFLVAAKLEDMAADASRDPERVTAAAKRSIEYLERAEKALPGTKTFYAWRGHFYLLLKDEALATADFERGNQITP
ncbi:MAG: serine/threonine protein kinase, partial [Planctomycetes bacterium]|nr:serine/threonine protein kinase [Planctomycetota bacterium]